MFSLSKMLLMTLLIGWLLTTSQAFAQTDLEGSYVLVQHFTIEIPDSGSPVEFRQLLCEFMEKVAAVNPRAVSAKILNNVIAQDSSELTVMIEFENWSIMNDSVRLQPEIIERAWPVKVERDAFMDRFASYIITHRDELYRVEPVASR